METEVIHTTYLLLGSNQGNRKEQIHIAIQKLTDQVGSITNSSAIYETEPWGYEDQPAFLNLIICMETTQNPNDLLQCIHSIETEMGRNRKTVRYGQRMIDIDILFYNDLILKNDNLRIPHPQIQNRMFTLIPLLEIAPVFVHPVLNKTITQLYKECRDTLKVYKFIENSSIYT